MIRIVWPVFLASLIYAMVVVILILWDITFAISQYQRYGGNAVLVYVVIGIGALTYRTYKRNYRKWADWYDD